MASSRSSKINTPLPAARPSAFRTYGEDIFSRNLNPFSRVSLLNVSDFPHGILFLNINSFEKSLLPSSFAPLLPGPKILIFFKSLSSLKKSTIPLTSGSSGPTITRSILFFRTQSLTSLKLLIFKGILIPSILVPPLPGAIYRLSDNLLLDIFHASACSLPPDPSIIIFILKIIIKL